MIEFLKEEDNTYELSFYIMWVKKNKLKKLKVLDIRIANVMWLDYTNMGDSFDHST